MRGGLGVGFVSVVILAACSAGGGGGRMRSDAGDGRPDGGGDDDGGGGGRDGGGGGDSGPRPDGFTECDGFFAMAERRTAPVDIIWVVDSSGSMENDATTVQDNLDDFARDIEARDVDFHVVMISDRGFVTPNPLFDTDPRFLFVDQGVGSHDAFDRAIDQFPEYMDHLRASAITHVIGVTDDDEDMSHTSFISTMEGLLTHSFTYHVIGSPPGECAAICSFICALGECGCGRPGDFEPAAAPSEEHWDAADATGGQKFSICTADWSGLFDTLAVTVAVSMELPCEFEIPPPPPMMSFDRDLVNVEYTPSGGVVRPFPRAPSEASCGGSEAWYYDDPDMPTAIILCPSACDAVTSGGGTVEIKLGCASILI